jgi:hypothetical protein
MKWREIRERTFAEFHQRRSNYFTVCQRELQNIACRIAEELGLEDFKVGLLRIIVPFLAFQASSWWIDSFKKQYSIVSRKITKIVTAGARKDMCNIEKTAKDFVADVTERTQAVQDSRILNTDQMGVNLEFSGKRTLNLRGEKAILGRVQKINATTHSFTIQPVISASGQLYSPLLVCFYEPSGAPQKFNRELARFTNLKCVSSKSGIMTSKLELEYIRDTLVPTVEPRSILLHDSWNGFKQAVNDTTVKAVFSRFFQIPPKTTAKAQPLDADGGFNFKFKQFLKALHHHIQVHHHDFILGKRVNIATLISLVDYQFCAPRFGDFIRYCFFKTGYISDRLLGFATPPEYCLKIPFTSKCKCGEKAIIKCAYCEKHLCFEHFVVEYHNCS